MTIEKLKNVITISFFAIYYKSMNLKKYQKIKGLAIAKPFMI
jgi:hypothetical protein